MTKDYLVTKKYRENFKARDPEGYKKYRAEERRKYYAKHKKAHDARTAKWAKEHPERIASIRKRSKEKQSPEARATSQLKSRYGITYSQKMEMLISQGSICPVCKTASPQKMKSGVDGWAVDHCHAYEKLTGGIKIRGILCVTCNSLLGFAKDSREILSAAIQYLDRHQI